MLLSIISLAITLVGVVSIEVVLVVLVGLVLFPLDNKGFSALDSNFNI